MCDHEFCARRFQHTTPDVMIRGPRMAIDIPIHFFTPLFPPSSIVCIHGHDAKNPQGGFMVGHETDCMVGKVLHQSLAERDMAIRGYSILVIIAIEVNLGEI